MAEYSICRRCFHSYVCEQFNEHKDDHNERCHFFNDHFVSAADVVEVVMCRDCKHFYYDTNKEPSCAFVCGLPRPKENDFCSYGERKEEPNGTD